MAIEKNVVETLAVLYTKLRECRLEIQGGKKTFAFYYKLILYMIL